MQHGDRRGLLAPFVEGGTVALERGQPVVRRIARLAIELDERDEAALIVEPERRVAQAAGPGSREFRIDIAEQLRVALELVWLDLVADHHLHGKIPYPVPIPREGRPEDIRGRAARQYAHSAGQSVFDWTYCLL